jgi:galactonate dehydratase
MDITVDFRSLWNLPTALKIARALEECEPYWFADPLMADNLDALATFAGASDVSTTVSETLATRWSVREVMERNAARVPLHDRLPLEFRHGRSRFLACRPGR